MYHSTVHIIIETQGFQGGEDVQIPNDLTPAKDVVITVPYYKA